MLLGERSTTHYAQGRGEEVVVVVCVWGGVHHMQSINPGQQLSEDDINQLSLKVAEFEGMVAKEVNVRGREQRVQRERAQVRLEASLVDAPALSWRMVVDDVTN